jgi:hypothetical protein
MYHYDCLLVSSCVGVWQNDRVEIIANDRECGTRPQVSCEPLTNRYLQRETEPHPLMSLFRLKSV